MKTVKVRGADGAPLEAQQLATFAHDIQGKKFRFAVTRLPDGDPAVTHRLSGIHVCRIPYSISWTVWSKAGREALERVIEKAGAERVAKALTEAERENRI